MSKIIETNNTVLPLPDGPNIHDLNGNLGAISYLDCLLPYSFNLIGSTCGASSRDYILPY